MTPVLPVTGGNGLAMRTSMFAEAAAGLAQCFSLVVGPPEDRLGAFRLPDGVRVEVLEAQHDTRLLLIGRAQPAAVRPQMLLQYGRPSLSGIMAAPLVSTIARRLGDLAPDLVVISRAYMLPLLDGLPPELANVPVAVDLDDDDAAYQVARAQLASRAGNLDDAAMYEAEAVVFERLLRAHAPRISRFWIASEAARASIVARLDRPDVSVIPNAVEMLPALMPAPDGPPRLLFVGNLGYEPNTDGVGWFIREILPRIRERRPAVKLTVAGSNCPADIRRLCEAAGADLADDPLSLDPVYAAATAVIVPLRLGSGSRLKIIEAGARGVPVVSTITGADGLDLDPHRHIILGDDSADGFAQACEACLSDLTEARRRAACLRQHVAENHDRPRVVGHIRIELQDLLRC